MKDQRRKDLKGRVLHTGESQIREGKFKGRYQYDYKDITGKRKHINSWRLTEADPVPKGRRQCKALRTLEEEVKKDLQDGIKTDLGNKTLNECIELYLKSCVHIKPSTFNNYQSVYLRYVKGGIGNLKIKDISYSTIKGFYLQLIKQNLSKAIFSNLNIVLNAVFDIALKDHVIRYNPCAGVMKEIKKNIKVPEKKVALTKDQQTKLLQYFKNSINFHQYYNLILFLLGTGCRIGEALGLVWDDIDFKKETVSINRTFSELHTPGGIERHMQTPKSETSKREIPLFSEVKNALINQRETDLFIGNAEGIDGINDFVFRTKKGEIVYAAAVRYALRCATDDLNEVELKEAEKKNREPILFPSVTPHLLRHTFCTRLCEVETNLKVIQSIMGHSSIKITMDVYADCSNDFKKEELKRVDGIIKIV